MLFVVLEDWVAVGKMYKKEIVSAGARPGNDPIRI